LVCSKSAEKIYFEGKLCYLSFSKRLSYKRGNFSGSTTDGRFKNQFSRRMPRPGRISGKYMEDLSRGTELFDILDRDHIIPKIQLQQIRRGVVRNPPLSPCPQQWWKVSFEWYIILHLLPGFEYGPFYRIDDSWFWPQIGIQADESSEKKCFYGLKRPENVEEAIRLYELKGNPMEYVYEFTIKASQNNFFNEALIFMGPVKKGEGFQINPNGITSKIIQLDILAGNVKMYKKLANHNYSKEPNRYIANV
jgi:hypothetical protein